jgi:RecB family exonuclease
MAPRAGILNIDDAIKMRVRNVKPHSAITTFDTDKYKSEGNAMEIRRINNSEIQTFKRCKRKWMLSYYLGLTNAEDEESSNLYIGKLVHAGLENYYKGDDIMQPVNDAEIAWATAHADTGTSDYEYEGNSDIELSRIMLEGYLEWLEESGADANFTITGAEEELETSLGQILGREVILHGRVDARFRDPDGHTILLDHKTVANFSLFLNRRLRLNEQLMTYAMLLRMVKGEEVQGAMLNMLRKVKRSARSKPPYYHRESVNFNVETLRHHYDSTVAVVNDILTLEDILKADPSLTNAAAYPTVDQDCDWKCPFLSICPMFGDGSNIEGAVANMLKAKEVYA